MILVRGYKGKAFGNNNRINLYHYDLPKLQASIVMDDSLVYEIVFQYLILHKAQLHTKQKYHLSLLNSHLQIIYFYIYNGL